jgi:hypothetical protein
MPLFYFHVCDGAGFVEDEEGRDLPDAGAARAEAVRGARGLMADDLQRGTLALSSFVEVEDEEHRLLFTISFKDMVEIDLTPPAKAPRG